MWNTSYAELNALPPEAFLDPSRFVTSYDTAGHGAEQYAKGLKISRESESVNISASGTWGNRPLGGGGVGCSCEGIGYHANTADLLRGFLAGPAPVIVHRWGGPDGGTVIKERSA